CLVPAPEAAAAHAAGLPGAVCTGVRRLPLPMHAHLWDGKVCNGAGHPTIRPATLLPTDQDAGLADIYCDRCVPSWRVLQVDPKREPRRVMSGHVLACPGCRRRLQVRVRKPAWRPTYAPRPKF